MLPVTRLLASATKFEPVASGGEACQLLLTGSFTEPLWAWSWLYGPRLSHSDEQIILSQGLRGVQMKSDDAKDGPNPFRQGCPTCLTFGQMSTPGSRTARLGIL